MEAICRPEIFWIFSDDFRLVSAEKYRKLTAIYGKKSEKFSAISSAFLPEPARTS
jgi:hypothetical protein